jgi:hypothetical protein
MCDRITRQKPADPLAVLAEVNSLLADKNLPRLTSAAELDGQGGADTKKQATTSYESEDSVSQLYEVRLEAELLDGHKGVSILLHRPDNHAVDDNGKPFAFSTAFTEWEKNALQAWFSFRFGRDPEVPRFRCSPHTPESYCLGLLGGPQRSFDLFEGEAQVPLPSRVSGWYDLRHAEAGPWAGSI